MLACISPKPSRSSVPLENKFQPKVLIALRYTLCDFQKWLYCRPISPLLEKTTVLNFHDNIQYRGMSFLRDIVRRRCGLQDVSMAQFFVLLRWCRDSRPEPRAQNFQKNMHSFWLDLINSIRPIPALLSHIIMQSPALHRMAEQRIQRDYGGWNCGVVAG